MAFIGLLRRMPAPGVPSRGEWLVAAVCGVSAVVLVSGQALAVVATAPLFGIAVLACRRAPVLAALAVLAMGWLHWAWGVPPENPGPLAAELVAAYSLGRYTSVSAGLVTLASYYATGLIQAGFGIGEAIFVPFLFGAPWAFGLLVRRRTDRALSAAGTVAEMSAKDPTALAAAAVTEERSRLAGEALGVVRTAVIAMRQRAEEADRDLHQLEPDGAGLSEIQVEGRHAVAELRRLLGLLRNADQAPSDPPAAAPVRRPWRVDTLIAAGVVALLSTEALVTGAIQLSFVLSVAVVATLALRRTDPGLACLLAVAPVAAAVVLDTPLALGVALAVTFGLLAWSIAVRGRLRGYAVLATLAFVTLLEVHLLEPPGNEPITAAVFLLPAIAGHLWSERDREERAALARASELRSSQQSVAEEAVRVERLRLARELHDVVSHAVGVMVLQAAAADALRHRDLPAARDAVRAVRDAGLKALSELDVLFGLLDAGAVGTAGLANAAPIADLAAALDDLVARLRAGGMRVSFTVDLPVETFHSATSYRVVQEALTNAARHAPGSSVTVDLWHDGHALDILVADDGQGGAPDGGKDEGGFGLVGLAERVRSLGGTLASGPGSDGGFVVHARLPLSKKVPT